jgi:hypothetical protein
MVDVRATRAVRRRFDHQVRDAVAEETMQGKSKLASAEQICVQQFKHSITRSRSTKMHRRANKFSVSDTVFGAANAMTSR